MSSFESITAQRRLTSFSVVEDTRAAVDHVLGAGAVDFSTGDQSGKMFLLGEEEQGEMQKATGALSSGLSVPKVVQMAAALVPRSFKESANVRLKLGFNPHEDGSNSLVLALTSYRGRFEDERRGFTDAIDRIACADIPWPQTVLGVDLGRISEEAQVGDAEVTEITTRMPDYAKLMKGKTKITEIPLGEAPLAQAA